MNSTITATEMRGINRSAVLETIRRQGPIARTQIAELLQVSLPTVMRIVDELIEEELVKPTGTKEWSGGRKRSLLEFNASGHLIIGVDMNESRLYGAVADLAGLIHKEVFIPHKTRGVESYDLLVQVIEQLLQEAGRTGVNIRGIGVAAPGITYYEEGVVQWAPTLEWRNFPLKENLNNHFKLPVVLDNDVNVAALGELYFGVGQQCTNLVLVIIGSGIGAGIIIDGGIYRGSHRSAGEIGFLLPDCSHMGVRREGYGALESLASGSSIAARARLALSGKLSHEQLDRISAEQVFEAYRRGEDWSIPIIRDTINYLSQMIVALAVCYDPDLIVFSGGVAKSADVFIDPILERIEGVIPVPPKLVVSKLGHRGAIMGAIVEILYNTADFYMVRKLT
jgi:glucokinase